MRIDPVSMGWLPFVRRRMRKSGLRLTVRGGRVYTLRAVETRQPETDAQLRARDVLARASEAAKREMADEERRLYWDTHAAEMGYKTARGACVAHHVKRIKEEERQEATRSAETLRQRAEVSRERRERRSREMEKERAVDVFMRKIWSVAESDGSAVWYGCRRRGRRTSGGGGRVSKSHLQSSLRSGALP